MARFGYETIGTLGNQDPDDRISGSVFTSGGTAGTGDSITVYIPGNQSGNFWKCAIYKHSDLSLIGETATTTRVTSSAWNTLNFIGSPTILASTDYILVCWANRTQPGGPSVAYDDGEGTIQGHFQAINYNGFPDPLVPTHEDRKYSIYCDYTELPTPPPTPAKAGGGTEVLHDFVRFPELTNSQMSEFYFNSPHKQAPEQFIAKVVKVTDGDTIRVSVDWRDFNFPIRFADLAAPELNENGGKASQSWLENLILGKEVMVELSPSRVEKWGRLLAFVMFRGMDMGELSILNGHAVAWEDRKT